MDEHFDGFAIYSRCGRWLTVALNGDHRKRKRSPSASVALEHQRERKLSSVKNKESQQQIQFKEFQDNVLALLSPCDHEFGLADGSDDTTPSILQYVLPTDVADVLEPSRRTKSEPAEDRTIARRLLRHEYSKVRDIQVDRLYAVLIAG
jgi:hypothetical protein